MHRKSRDRWGVRRMLQEIEYRGSKSFYCACYA